MFGQLPPPCFRRAQEEFYTHFCSLLQAEVEQESFTA